RGGCVERTPPFVTIWYRFACTGAECDFGSSTCPSTAALARSATGTVEKTAFSQSNPRRRIFFRLAGVSSDGKRSPQLSFRFSRRHCRQGEENCRDKTPENP